MGFTGAAPASAGKRLIAIRAGQASAAAVPSATEAAALEIGGGSSSRVAVDLTGMTQVRFQADITGGGPTGVNFTAQYSNDGAVTWNDISTIGPSVTNGMLLSAWTNLPAGARGDVIVRVVVWGGDGITAVGETQVFLEARP